LNLLGQAVAPDSELITLYWGGPMDNRQAELAAESVSNQFPDVDIELLPGGQPHYHFIISIE
jgi:dihydroxyacetone kinase-like predicted kinase